MALVQSAVAGSASGTVTAGNTITSSAGGFSGATTLGNLLVCVAYTQNTGNGDPGDLFAPVTGGGYAGTWFAGSSSTYWQNGSDGGGAAVWWIADAPVMSPTQTTTIVSKNAGSVSGTLAVEVHLYEFNNVANPVVYDLSTDGDVNPGNAGGTPIDNWVGDSDYPVTSNIDLILCLLSASAGTNLTAGTGYTLGLSATVATIGQLEYQVNAPAGQSFAGFVGTELYWGCYVIAFSAAAAPTVTVTSVAPSSGPTTGGTTVTIVGTGFASPATVDFGVNAATSVAVASSTLLYCVAPAGSVGYVTVAVTDTNGTGALADGYLYVAVPTGKNQIVGGPFQDALGNPLANGYLVFRLQHDAAALLGGQVVGNISVIVPLDANGYIQGTISGSPVMIWPNDQMTPANGNYLIWAYDSRNRLAWDNPQVQQVLSTPAPFNVNAWTPGP